MVSRAIIPTTIFFRNVGRDKCSWHAVLKPVTDRGILAQIRKHGRLASRDIDFEIAEDGRSGVVIVGDFRAVGTFTIEPPYTSAT